MLNDYLPAFVLPSQSTTLINNSSVGRGESMRGGTFFLAIHSRPKPNQEMVFWFLLLLYKMVKD